MYDPTRPKIEGYAYIETRVNYDPDYERLILHDVYQNEETKDILIKKVIPNKEKYEYTYTVRGAERI